MALSVVRQNYHESCEMAVNKQINMELFASYTYMSMACYFDRDDLAFPGFYAYFKKQSDEEREHASKLMRFQNDRGGRVMLQPIAKPAKDEWGTPLQAVSAALELEKTVNASLLELHQLAGQMNDPHMCDFIETHFLGEQVESIRELAGMATRLERCGPKLGEFLFDKELQS